MSPFHARTARPISTKFCTDLPTNSGKVLNKSMIPPTRTLDPRVPQTPKPKRITGEKTLCNVKCPNGWRKLIKFFPGSAEAWLASLKIILVKRVCWRDKMWIVSEGKQKRKKWKNVCKICFKITSITFLKCIFLQKIVCQIPEQTFTFDVRQNAILFLSNLNFFIFMLEQQSDRIL